MDQAQAPIRADAPRLRSEEWLVGIHSDVAERGRLVVEAAGRTVGIYRLDGDLYAYENVCPHQGGPICQGLLVPRVLELIDENLASRGNQFDEDTLHIVCPWHGFEFDVRSGAHAGSVPVKLKAVPVSEREGQVYVTI